MENKLTKADVKQKTVKLDKSARDVKLTKAEERRFEKYKKEFVMHDKPENYIHVGLDPSFHYSDFIRDLAEALARQRKEIIEKLEKRKLPKPGGWIPVSDVKSFNFDSYKDGIDKSIQTIKDHDK